MCPVGDRHQAIGIPHRHDRSPFAAQANRIGAVDTITEGDAIVMGAHVNEQLAAGGGASRNTRVAPR
jgi:hypothetical protein